MATLGKGADVGVRSTTGRALTAVLMVSFLALATGAGPAESASLTDSAPTPPSVTVGGQPVVWDAPPFMTDGLLVVPLRSLAEPLNYTYQWDSTARRTTVKRGAREVSFAPGSRRYISEGEGHFAGTLGKIVDGRLCVSLRFLAQALDVSLTFDAKTGVVDLDPACPYTAVVRMPRPGYVAYITIDDGPAPDTPAMLDVLAKYKAPATFFLIGGMAKLQPEMVKRIVAEGHALGNHTFHHAHEPKEPDWCLRSVEAYIAELDACDRLIADITGLHPRATRAPGGSWPHLTAEFRKALDERGYVDFIWNVGTLDWAWPRPSPDQMLEEVVVRSWNGSMTEPIILIHDGVSKHTQTVEALPAIIEYLRYAGYTLGTLP